MLQYFISTHGARKGLADTALKTANSGYLTRRLVDVAQDAIITEFDCGTIDGIEMTPLVEGGEIIEPLGDRILGRVALEDVVDPLHRRGAGRGQRRRSTRTRSSSIEDAGIDEVKIRSVLTCQTRRGICVAVLRPRPGARLHGQHRRGGRRHRRPVDRRAGHAADDAHVPHRRRGDAARGAVARSRPATTGTVKFANLATVKKRDGTLVVMNRHGELVIVDETGRERERYGLIYGAKLHGRRRRQGRSRASCSPSGIRSRCRSSPRSPAS